MSLRIAVAALLLVLYLFGIVRFETAAQATHYLLAVGGFALASAIVIAGRLLFSLRITRAMAIAMPIDLAVIGALVFSLEHYEDPIYPLALLLPVYFSLFFRRREAWMLGVLFASAYFLGHVPKHLGTPGNFAFLALSALALILINGRIAYSIEQQRMREEEALAAVAEKDLLNDTLRQRVSELQAVSEISDLIHSSLDFDDVGPLVLDILAKVINVPSCCLFVVDKARSETLFSASTGTGSTPVEVESPLDSDVASISVGGEHFSCVSILDHKQMLVVFCSDVSVVEELSAEDYLVLNAVAHELVVAVENSQLYKLTKRLSITDEITGLFNYRYLQQRLDEEIERARRYGHSVALLMVDVDDFKGFNDTHGHIAGDKALADLASAMVASVREVDVVCRYGGEEFAVVLPESAAEGAYIVAEKIRERIAAYEFANADGARYVHLTVSIGLATLPGHVKEKEDLLREADDALYRAKNGGKNRVRVPAHRSTDAKNPDEASGDVQGDAT